MELPLRKVINGHNKLEKTADVQSELKYIFDCINNFEA